MTSADRFELPSYLDMPPKMEARYAELLKRDVVLETRSLGKNFETSQGVVKALEDVHFDVRRREFCCVVGPSGCGKSTLVRILAGLEDASSGEVLLDGAPVRGPGADRGMVFQGYTLFPWLTVKENVMFGPRIKGVSSVSAESQARQWLELVALLDFENHYPHQLSGGMKQRVAIARALANEPRVLLMDEPFGALDAQTRSTMQALLLEIWRNVNVTIVFITHDLDEAVYLADRVVFLKAHPGHVQEVIQVPVARPRSPEQFLTPHFLATKKRLEELIHPPGLAMETFNIKRQTAMGDDAF